MKNYKLTPRQRKWERRYDCPPPDSDLVEWNWKFGVKKGIVLAKTRHKAKELVKGLLMQFHGRLAKDVTVTKKETND